MNKLFDNISIIREKFSEFLSFSLFAILFFLTCAESAYSQSSSFSATSSVDRPSLSIPVGKEKSFGDSRKIGNRGVELFFGGNRDERS